jgi:hypothetical protein
MSEKANAQANRAFRGWLWICQICTIAPAAKKHRIINGRIEKALGGIEIGNKHKDVYLPCNPAIYATWFIHG